MIPDEFIELHYGKHKTIDLHRQTKEDARISLIYAIESLDIDIKCLIVVHGYHGGTVIKKLVREEFKHPRIAQKINHDAGRTIFLIKN